MRISVWLLLAQQTFCAAMILWATALRLRATPSSGRLVCLSILGGLSGTFAVMLPHPAVRIGCAVSVLWLSCSSLRPLPLAIKAQGLLPASALTVIATGLVGAVSANIAAVFAPLCAVCLPLLPLADRRTPALHTATLQVSCQHCTLRLCALIDSGNLLHDHHTGLPVIVCARQAVAPLLALSEAEQALRQLNARTASGHMVLSVFRADSIVLSTGRTQYPLQATLAAAPEGFDSFDALVPASVTANLTATM